MASISIDYSPPNTVEHPSRLCRVPQLWGKIRQDWSNNNFVPSTDILENSLAVDVPEKITRPCSVRLKRCSLSSYVWDVQKFKLEDETVQLVYQSVRVDKCDQPKDVDKDQTVNIDKKKKQLKWFSSELKSQVLSYSKTHSLDETCDKFEVSKRSLRRWKADQLKIKMPFNCKGFKKRHSEHPNVINTEERKEYLEFLAKP